MPGNAIQLANVDLPRKMLGRAVWTAWLILCEPWCHPQPFPANKGTGPMLRNPLVMAAIIAVSACSPRGEIEFGAQVPGGAVQEVWVANLRHSEGLGKGQKAPPRPTELTFQKYEVSVPQGHQPGKVEWPRGNPDANTDFVTLSRREYPSIGSFASSIAKADQSRTNETALFVHGYNTTHGEAVYQLAQVGHDFEIPSPTVLFSWPSAAVTAAYVYDRDSALFARDQLEEVIVALTQAPGRKLVIVGHSMGNLLVMETLRQIEISGSVDIGAKIDGLFMISPDLDGELFRTQAARLKNMPDPSVIVAVEQDKALRISAILTGKTSRLGSQTDRSAVGDLAVSVVDASDLATGGLNHSVLRESPSAIAIIKNLHRNSLPGETHVAPLLDLSALR
jgi:esterase/lipase superfamily enzyme